MGFSRDTFYRYQSAMASGGVDALKMWTGWPTFPMIFVRGVLIGGYDDLKQLQISGELATMLTSPRSDW
jgi:glutaredoxin-related protein